MSAFAVTVTGKEKVELLSVEPGQDLAAGEIRGRTLVSLVSPGTELAWNYTGDMFPTVPGYAAVVEVEMTGDDVAGITPGDRMFLMGNHRSVQQGPADAFVPVPYGLAPETAVLARLAGVSMTTLMTTAARPGDTVLVTGAGPVGYLCAHLFSVSGYNVHVADPDEARRELVRASGIGNVYASADEYAGLTGNVALVVDCSGHEQAVLDGARTVRRKGEVVLVGVPWRKCTDLSAHALLDVVFHKYAMVRSGWEWELPVHGSKFSRHSIMRGFRLALKWLAEGRIPVDGLITMHDPARAQDVYQALLKRQEQGLFQVFDWTRLDCGR